MPYAVFTSPPRRYLLAACAVVVVALAAWTAWAVAPPGLPRALEAQRALADRHPEDAGAQVDLGNLLALSGEVDEAEAAYLRALAIDERFAAAHYNLGLLLQQRGESTRALRSFRRTIDLDSAHAWAHYQIGTIEAARGFDTLAVRSYARAFALDPRLRFPDVNPHVIDNPLVTRAMLAAYRLNLAPDSGPPDFDDPFRIAGLLAEGALETSTEPPPAAPAPVVGAPGPAARDQPPISRGRLLDPYGQAGGGRQAEDARLEPAFSRTIGADDLQPSRSGQVVGQSGGSAGRGQGYGMHPQYQPMPDPEETQDDGGGEVDGGGANAPRFRPGIQSTGRLDLELVPVSGRA
jgi:hypothetical protein